MLCYGALFGSPRFLADTIWFAGFSRFRLFPLAEDYFLLPLEGVGPLAEFGSPLECEPRDGRFVITIGTSTATWTSFKASRISAGISSSSGNLSGTGDAGLEPMLHLLAERIHASPR
jgi:hypothetical protein